MNAKKRSNWFSWLVLPALLLSACSSPTSAPPTTLSPGLEETLTSKPTSTQTPRPTLTPTAMPSLTPTETPTQTPTMIPTVEGGGGWIAFQHVDSHEIGSSLSVMDSNGRGRVALTDMVSNVNPKSHGKESFLIRFGSKGPDWSPDSKKLAFSANSDIYIMDADGSQLKRLTNSPGSDEEPSWSPDGEQIAFVSDRDGEQNVYIMDADGSNQRPLIQERSTNPDWSPDGSQIVYSAVLGGKVKLKIANADGSGGREVLANNPQQDEAAWSPDGKRIAFIQLSGLNQLMVMNPDGTDVVNIAGASFDPHRPAWSPDGNWLAFFCPSCKNPGIYKVKADGSSKPIRLTDLAKEMHAAEDLAWGNPDGHIYPDLVKAHNQRLRSLLPSSRIAKEALGPDKGTSEIEAVFPVAVSRLDWVLVDLAAFYLPVPAGWSLNTTSYDLITEIAFYPGESLENPEAVVNVSILDYGDYLTWLKFLHSELADDPAFTANLVEVDKDRAYLIASGEEDGQKVSFIYYLTTLKNLYKPLTLILLASSKGESWNLYYPIFREIIAHWYSFDFELIGNELPIELTP